MKRIRILFIVNGFAIGGGELKLLELVEQIQLNYSDRFEVFICSVGQGGPMEDRFRALAPTWIFEKKNAYDLSQIWKVIRLIRDRRIDLVQTTLFYADVIGALAARIAGVRHVVSWEAITQPYAKKHLLAYRLAAKWFSRSVAVSHTIQQQVTDMRRVDPRKAMTIHYGVDTDLFKQNTNRAAVRKSLSLCPDTQILGTVARFTEQKGHCYLLDAAPDIVRSHPNVRFVFAGDGPLRTSIEAQADRLGVKSHCCFLGFRSDVTDLLNAFDVFVLPSLYEGLPNVVLEAMACGLPVVATAVDGTPEAVRHGVTGFLVPPKDPGALANALIRLLEDENIVRLMGRNGRLRAEEVFSLDGQVRQFIHLYEQLTHQKDEVS